MDLQTGLVILVVVFAAAVKGATGIGFPLIATPVVATLEGVQAAVVIMAIPTWFSNLIILFQIGPRDLPVRRFLPFLIALIAGTVAGALLLATLNARFLSIALGTTVVLYIAVRTLHPGFAIKPAQERWAGPIAAIGAGLFGGTTNVFGPVLATYLHALRLEPRTFVGAISLLFSIGNATQILSYARLDLYTVDHLIHGAAYCLPMLAGLALGIRVQSRLNPIVFNRVVLVVLALSAANLLIRGVTG